MAGPSPQNQKQARPLTQRELSAASDAEHFLEASTLRLLYYQASGPPLPCNGKMTPQHNDVLGAVISTATGAALPLLAELPVAKQQEVVRGAVLKLLNGELSSSRNLAPGEGPFWEDGELRMLRSILYRFDTYVVSPMTEPDIREAAERRFLRNLSEGHIGAADKLSGYLSREFIHGKRMQEALTLFVVQQIDGSVQRELNFREFFQRFPLNIHAAALQVASEVQSAVNRWRLRCGDSKKISP